MLQLVSKNFQQIVADLLSQKIIKMNDFEIVYSSNEMRAMNSCVQHIYCWKIEEEKPNKRIWKIFEIL